MLRSVQVNSGCNAFGFPVGALYKTTPGCVNKRGELSFSYLEIPSSDDLITLGLGLFEISNIKPCENMPFRAKIIVGKKNYVCL